MHRGRLPEKGEVFPVYLQRKVSILVCGSPNKRVWNLQIFPSSGSDGMTFLPSFLSTYQAYVQYYCSTVCTLEPWREK
jgi:hypothetical protein